jgi:E3 ubiquitin-protein ligase RFWD2
MALPQQQQQQQQGLQPQQAQQQQQQQQGALAAEKKRKIMQQFDELQEVYISSRLRRSSGGTEQLEQQQQQQLLGGTSGNASTAAAAGQTGGASGTSAAAADAGQIAAAAAAAAAGALVGANDEGAAGLDAFSDVLSAVTHFNSLSTLAYIPPSTGSAAAAAARNAAGTSSSSACNILSSLEFDCKDQLFAAAGVQQRICVYNYQSVLAGAAADPQQPNPAAAAAAAGVQPSLEPLLDLPTQHKISCTSFSSAVQQYLLSSDYEGLVHLWDLNSAKIVRQWEAHERRIWVVDSCGQQPDQFATGSDDGTVKVRPAAVC